MVVCFTSPIMYLICPLKVCITFVSHFSCVLQPSQEKLKTILMENFFFGGGGGAEEQIRCIVGDVQVANRGQVLNFFSIIIIVFFNFFH